MKRLFPHHLEIIRMIADGMTRKQIGAVLGIANPTVDWHITRIHAVIGFSDPATLTRWAIKAGLVQDQHDFVTDYQI